MTRRKPLEHDGLRVVLIGGPTASGKSALAMDLARAQDGIIINADAMQIYAGLPILTAQPTQADRAAVPHDLYAVTPPDQPSSSGKWLVQAHAAIAHAHATGRLPIVVGGTGLYFTALRQGLADIPAIPDAVRQASAALYDRIGEAAFRQDLAAHDPESAARIARNDRQRLLRAQEVAMHTGRSLSAWQQAPGAPSDHIYETHLVMPPRDELYARCDRRFLNMIKQGALAEVAAFMARGLSADLPAAKIIGVRELADHLTGLTSLDHAIAQAQMMTRRYAKRQMTWFRHQWQGNQANGDGACGPSAT